MDGSKLSYDELKNRCDDLQGQVIRFLKVEQDLVHTRNQLDRDLARFMAIQLYSQRAIQTESLQEFNEITIESVVETFELECSTMFYYDNEKKAVNIEAVCGIDEELVPDCKLDKDWISERKLDKKGKVQIEKDLTDSTTLGKMGLSQVIISPFYDEEGGLQGILIGGISVEKKDYYDEITEELIPSFTVFTQQMSALLQNFQAKRSLDAKVQKRTAEVIRQKKEIEEKNEELNMQKEELQITLENLQLTQNQLIEAEKMSALGGLVAGVAHEINTPVGISITASSNLMEQSKWIADLYKEDKISRVAFKEYLNMANQSAKLILSNMERTAAMVQSFKQVSVDQSTEQKRIFKLKEYTEDIIRSLWPKIKTKKIQIGLDIDEKLELDSYPGAYSQVVTNLVLNSITHGFEGKQKGKIELTAKSVKHELVIQYKDDGIGISGTNLKKIFEPFFTTNKKAGTGLGMHIVYNLVNQKLKGRIECMSEQGKGVMFEIKIPV